MDKKEITAVWQAFLEVQEGKKKKNEKLDPVGQEDGDIDNDGDKDSSDEYLAKRRKAIGKAMKKDDVKEGEESPYPSLDKKKREKKGSNLEPANTPSDKLKGESVEEASCGSKVRKEEDEVECPKCKGKGCDHCDGKGYHTKESYELSDQEILDELTDKDRATIAKRKQMRQNPSTAAKMKGRPTDKKSARADAIRSRRVEDTELSSDEQLDELGNPKSRRYNPPGMYKKKTPSQRKREIRGLDSMGKSIRDKETVHNRAKKESYELSDQEILDELTDKDRATIAKRKQMRQNPSTAAKMKGRPTAGKSARAAAIRGRRMEGVELFSEEELAAIEEKMSQTAGATPSEPFMSTNSAGEKKFYADHEKGSEKKYEDWEETSENDGSKAGRAVKSQSPARRGDNRKGDTAMPTVSKAKGQ